METAQQWHFNGNWSTPTKQQTVKEKYPKIFVSVSLTLRTSRENP